MGKTIYVLGHVRIVNSTELYVISKFVNLSLNFRVKSIYISISTR